MKTRKSRAILYCLLALLAVPAAAQTAEDRIVRQLREQGFEEIEVSRTLLGRVRIVAIEDDTLREIVLNPSTGAILRDYWTEIDDDDDDDSGKGRGRGRGRGDRDEGYLLDSDDDGDDD